LAFQPTLGFGKDRLSDYEVSTVKYLTENERTDWLTEAGEAWAYVGQLIKKIPDSQNVKIYNLSNIFKDYKKSAYIDSCHYVPEAMDVIASRLSWIIKQEFLEKERR
jgi:hypothetical protein